jgi:hypothetical protein
MSMSMTGRACAEPSQGWGQAMGPRGVARVGPKDRAKDGAKDRAKDGAKDGAKDAAGVWPALAWRSRLARRLAHDAPSRY